jgi:hypothetical protein
LNRNRIPLSRKSAGANSQNALCYLGSDSNSIIRSGVFLALQEDVTALTRRLELIWADGGYNA